MSLAPETRMQNQTQSFFVTGGTMPANAPSYIERNADTELYQRLKNGELCYVLNARQMGKSSLINRVAQRCKQNNIFIAQLDLTSIGQSVTPQQWYYGLLLTLAQQLDTQGNFDFEDTLDDFWFDHEQMAPMQRFFEAIHRLVLPALGDRLLVISVDEIDAVRSLSAFNTDEFFAGIRECYLRRSRDGVWERVTFCLLGTTTPAELIKDARITPFNVGRRIELRDFTPEEATPLGKRVGAGLLSRILFWTGGHPYLTQRVAAQVSDLPGATVSDVDTIVSRLFLAHGMRETDDNLSLVSNRLLTSDCDRFALLSLYRQVLRGKKVADDDTNPLCDVLKLSGVVTVAKGLLRVRNEIYRRVFDDAWVVKHLPGVEVRRQKAAFVRGLGIAGAIAGIVLCIIGSLAYIAQTQANIARRNADIARKETARANKQTTVAEQRAKAEAEQRQRADRQTAVAGSKAKEATEALIEARKQRELADKKAKEAADNLALANRRLAEANAAKMAEGVAKNEAIVRAEEARRSAEKAKRSAEIAKAKTADAERASYIANMNLIQSKWEENNVGRVRELLEETKNYKDRGFEWGYWNRLCHLDLVTFKGHSDSVFSVAFSPDGKRIVTGSWDSTAKVWDANSGKELMTLKGHSGEVISVAFSPDGKRIVTGSYDGTAKVWFSDIEDANRAFAAQEKN